MFVPPTEEAILAGAKKICETVASGPFFIGRNGTIEIEVLFFWILNRQRGNSDYPPRLREQIQRNAGIFPDTNDSIDRWCEAYMRSLEDLDGGAAGWYQPTWHLEKSILDARAPTAFRTPLRSLEPYYMPAGARWTEHLAGKKVAVVSSFTETIKGQLKKNIWREKGILDISGVSWSFVQTGYAPTTALGHATWPKGCDTWELAVNHVIKEVGAADIALIGCGGLGMIIAGELRKRGVSCIVLGGAIQVLFGIKGARWAQHNVISKFWNDDWVWPAAEEIPGGANLVEGGCYWQPCFGRPV